MAALARGRCPKCGGTWALRKDGRLREHHVRKSQLEQVPSRGMAGTHRLCDGSGKTAMVD